MTAATAFRTDVATASGNSNATLVSGRVTVLIFHALGAVALLLGIKSAPVWLIIAGGAAGISAGTLAFVAAKRHLQRNG